MPPGFHGQEDGMARRITAAAWLGLVAGVAAGQDGDLLQSGTTAIVGATVMTAGPAGTLEGATVVFTDGRIVSIGVGVEIPADAQVIDAAGRFLLPGIIDTHSHMGVYPWPSSPATSDGNEATWPVTAEVRAADSIHVEDPAFERARAGGVTTVMVLPGSANLIGGHGAVLKLRRSARLTDLLFEGAPAHMKMACGENPKRVYGNRGQSPSTRMGSAARLRQVFTAAREYGEKWERHAAKTAAAAEKGEDPPDPPERDLRKESLLAVIRGETHVHLHGYTVSDYTSFLRVFDEFGIRPRVLHHALEAYKMRDELKSRGIAISTWADWWGFKVEAYDGIPQNAAICAADGINVAIHSDSSSGVQRLWHEVSKCVRWGLPEEEALRAITLNPAWQVGVHERTGSIEVGKDADFALFSRHPFDVTTRVDGTWIDGVRVFTREDS